eukprot:g1268.t1
MPDESQTSGEDIFQDCQASPALRPGKRPRSMSYSELDLDATPGDDSPSGSECGTDSPYSFWEPFSSGARVAPSVPDHIAAEAEAGVGGRARAYSFPAALGLTVAGVGDGKDVGASTSSGGAAAGGARIAQRGGAQDGGASKGGGRGGAFTPRLRAPRDRKKRPPAGVAGAAAGAPSRIGFLTPRKAEDGALPGGGGGPGAGGGGALAPSADPAQLPYTGHRIGIYTPEERKKRIARFHEMRKRRTYRKKIKYSCRKTLADHRLRIKGRFVKCAGDLHLPGAAAPAAEECAPGTEGPIPGVSVDNVGAELALDASLVSGVPGTAASAAHAAHAVRGSTCTSIGAEQLVQ